MMRQAKKPEPKMWGDSIIGFGSYHYVGKSSEGDWFLIGPLASEADADPLRVWRMGKKYVELRERLGKHSLGKGCLYIKRLQDVKPAGAEDADR